MDSIVTEHNDYMKLDRWMEWLDGRDDLADALSLDTRTETVAYMLFALTFRQPWHPRAQRWADRAEELVQSCTNFPGAMIVGARLFLHYTFFGEVHKAERLLEHIKPPDAGMIDMSVLSLIQWQVIPPGMPPWTPGRRWRASRRFSAAWLFRARTAFTCSSHFSCISAPSPASFRGMKRPRTGSSPKRSRPRQGSTRCSLPITSLSWPGGIWSGVMHAAQPRRAPISSRRRAVPGEGSRSFFPASGRQGAFRIRSGISRPGEKTEGVGRPIGGGQPRVG